MLTWIEINATAFRANLKAFHRNVGDEVRLMPVIKSNAYGHGLLEIAALCDLEISVDRLCVVGLTEALHLIRGGIKKPVVVLSFFDYDKKDVSEAILSDKIAFPVYSLEQARFLSKVAVSTNKKVLVHLKIDTGTSRLGIRPDEAEIFVKKMKAMPNLELEGVFSHFSSSEENKKVTFDQERIFRSTINALGKAGHSFPLRHIACSASTMLYDATHENSVRPGVGIYGIFPSNNTKRAMKLTPVLSFHTRIIQIKTVEKGTAIGYGQSYIVRKKTTIATLPIGYFDGFDRGFSNIGQVIIRGVKCPVRGRVCMNLTMVEIPPALALKIKTGEEVVLIGKQKKADISANDWAKKLGTISYEVLARLGAHIPRIISSKNAVR